MKRNKSIGIMMMAATMVAATSCSDYSDYNEVPADPVVSGNQSLWENISQNERLSDFAELLKRTGFDAELNASNYYTVWAPVNGSFSKADYDLKSDSLILAQFVNSHVAKYAHAATGYVHEPIHTLNQKSFLFDGDGGTYTYDRLNISQANLPSRNGLMHLLDGVAMFYPNLYEYLSMAEGVDSLRNYFKKYELTYLDTEASVKGPMVDGKQTYRDSVLITSNSLIGELRAFIANEDSSYTFLMPTDKAYRDMYNRLKPSFNFIDRTLVQDAENFTAAGGSQTKYVDVDAAYLTDSLIRRYIVRNLIFSNNDIYNQWLTDAQAVYTDTLRSTRNTKLSNPREILSHTIDTPEEMSNGYVRKVDSLVFYPWETYNREIEINPRDWMANLFNGSRNSSQVPDTLINTVFGDDAEFNSYRYVWVQPSGDRMRPDYNVLLPNVMSTTYNFYVVFLPSALRPLGNDPRPNKLNFTLNYCQKNGTTANYVFSKAYADSLLTGGKLPAVPTSANMTTAFENDPYKTDTVFIGQFTFPVAYNGLGGSYYPNIRVNCPLNVFDDAQLATYTRDVRIAAILMKPVELEEFEANKQ